MPLIGNTAIVEIDPEASAEERDRDWLSSLVLRESPSRRGMSLAVAAAIENMLGALLVSDGSAKKRPPFSALIELARCRGLLGVKEAKMCLVIKEIRNVFAHEERAYFGFGPLVGLTLRLKELDERLAGREGFWLFRGAADQIALSLRAKMREAGLLRD